MTNIPRCNGTWLEAHSGNSRGSSQDETIRAYIQEALYRINREESERPAGVEQAVRRGTEEVGIQRGGNSAQTEQRGVLESHSSKTQDFFSDTVSKRANRPKSLWFPNELNDKQRRTYEVWKKFNGGFSEHIDTSIPNFREVELQVIKPVCFWISLTLPSYPCRTAMGLTQAHAGPAGDNSRVHGWLGSHINVWLAAKSARDI